MADQSSLAAAIIQLENVNPSYNNPGAITDEYPGFTGDYFNSSGVGATGIPIYDSPESGLAALQSKLSNIFSGNSSVYSPDMTLDQFGDVYAPNQNYGSKLASILGVPSTTQLSSLQSGVPGDSSTSSGSL